MVVVARSVEPLQKLKEEYPKQVEVVSGDLADLSLPQKAVDAALKSFGQLDGMVLNHGILGQTGNVAVTDVKEWQKAFDVNFFSLVAFVRSQPFLIFHFSSLWVLLTVLCNRLQRVFLPSASPREESSLLPLVLLCASTVAGVSTLPPRLR